MTARRTLTVLAATAALASLAACNTTAAADGKSISSVAASGPARPAGGHGNAAFMGSYDVNRDGVVTQGEYDSVRKQRFSAADTNGDGWLSEAEYVAEFEGRLQQQYAAASKAPDARYEGSMKQAYVRFKVLDTNKDGKLTNDEELAIADRSYKRADANGDGKVDGADEKIAAAKRAAQAATPA